jgi:hypothetical protein
MGEGRGRSRKMIRKHFRFKRFVLGLALGFVVAAVVAPAALTKPVNSNVQPTNAPTSAQVYMLSGGNAAKAPLVTDHGGQNRGPSVAQVYMLSGGNAAKAPLVTDHGGQNRGPSVDLGPLDPWAYSLVHRDSSTPAPTTIKSSSSSPGFDFGDAGIGAGVSFGAALILLASIGLGRRYRRSHRSGLVMS